MRFSVERAIGAGLWIALTTLVLLSATDYWGTAHFLATAEQVDHAHQVLEQLDRLLAQVTDAETGQRGYLITGAVRYLEPYDRAVGAIGETLDTLRTMTVRDETQRDRVTRLDPLVGSRLAIMRRTMAIRDRDGLAAAQRLVLTDRGKSVMDAIRTLVGEIGDEERRILADRSRAARRSGRLTILIILCGDLAAFALAGGSHLVAVRGLAARKRHAAAVEAARRHAEQQADELRALARALDDARRTAQDASRFKSEFLASVSHEIRSPMTAILGYAELLAEPTTPERQRVDAVEVVRRNGEHLLSVVNDVLDLSKIEAGKLVVERLPCGPSQVVAEATALLRPRAEAKGLAFEVAYRTPVPATVTTDPTRLRQILINLLANAIKFTAAGSVRLEVSLEQSASGSRLVFAVSDTGIGLSPDEQARIFDAFAQAGPSTTRRFGGTGLGLAISKRLAELLGGEIRVASVPGSGSTFSLLIDTGPLADVPMVAGGVPDVTPPRPPSEGPTRCAGRILLAEDGADNRELVAHHLRVAGAEVTTAPDGLVACELASAAAAAGTPFDLILMDIQMPRLNGYGAVARLRAEGYQGPIVALTAHALAADRERCLAAGCNDFATKPITRHALLRLVTAHLRPRDVGAAIVSDVARDREVSQVLAAFVQRLPDRLAAMDRACRGDDREGLAALAHQLRGAASGYGFPAITAAAAALESAASTGRDIERRLAELADLCRRARAGATNA